MRPSGTPSLTTPPAATNLEEIVRVTAVSTSERDDFESRTDAPVAAADPSPTIVIEPRSGWRLIDWNEMRDYSDLFRFLIWRGLKARYAQSAIGIGWGVIQPVFSAVIFTVVFGRLARINSDGLPYSVFAFVGLVPWTYFAGCVNESVTSLISNSQMISKVYFPRLILPFTALFTKLVDFSISMMILALLLAWNRIVPGWEIIFLPALLLLLMITAAGIGAWLSALAIQYRDVQHATGFGVQLLMYAAPVVYPASLIPDHYDILGWTINPQWIYALNPMVGIIEGFRAALLNSRPMPWDYLAIGSTVSVLIAVTGLLYFRRREHIFADVA